MGHWISCLVNGQKVCVFTGWRLMEQLSSIPGSTFKLTANGPYPTFMWSFRSHGILFNLEGGMVGTMIGNVLAHSFDEIKPINYVLPELEWKTGLDSEFERENSNLATE